MFDDGCCLGWRMVAVLRKRFDLIRGVSTNKFHGPVSKASRENFSNKEF